MEHPNSLRWLSAGAAASLLGMSVQAVRKACAAGRYTLETVKANGGSQYRILLSSLPQSARIRYWEQQGEEQALIDQRVFAERYEADPELAARVDAVLSSRRQNKARLSTETIPVTDWSGLESLSEKALAEAKRRHEIVCAFEALQKSGAPKMQCYQIMAEQHGESGTTVWRWFKQVKGLPRKEWLPALAPRWKGKAQCAEFSEDAWAFIKSEWGRQSQPSLAAVYRRCQQLAQQNGWDLPSVNTVERRINAEPAWWQVYVRQGKEALSQMYPAAQRDYSSLALHQMWVSDGRKADLFCRWPDGTISRPIVLGWLDVRTRMCLGYEVGRVENADLIRLAFRAAASNSKALPSEALLDNGRGYASKMLTGGQPTRYRFKVKEEDTPGILTLLGINVIWATPGHGQSKPIESWWRTVAQIDKRTEFQGAYCGNRPDAKPEEFDIKKAVPIEQYLSALKEDIAAYNLRPHRGDSMELSSPMSMYQQLAEHTVIRSPAAEQLRMCLLTAESVRLNEDHSVTILGNRYWTERMADLPNRGPYAVRFNPENASDPVSVYSGARFLCEAPLIAKTGFRDQEAAKTHTRARNQFVKAKKQEAHAFKQMNDALRWKLDGDVLVDTETGEVLNQDTLPTPKVVAPVRPTKNYAKNISEFKSTGSEMSSIDFQKAFERGIEKVTAISNGR
ncbi:hypothetical protein PS900_06105 [Pseudomonas fluorescens]|uniref:Integrase catalytic domain-containing protein n=1 Tax=Pseudomonas fluorescens TaxID=294 RepID=A0A8H2RUK1_PSEFL|nr:transposase domain-containing protein [Pseudomonas fluorescens]VVP59739.1 hypothetical protein PS900_06105 [Pseudomonas fluorescens]